MGTGCRVSRVDRRVSVEVATDYARWKPRRLRERCTRTSRARNIHMFRSGEGAGGAKRGAADVNQPVPCGEHEEVSDEPSSVATPSLLVGIAHSQNLLFTQDRTEHLDPDREPRLRRTARQ